MTFAPVTAHLIVSGTAPRKNHPFGAKPLTDDEWSYIWTTLDTFLRHCHNNGIPLHSLSHGCAQGVDTVAATWAERLRIKVHEFPADWAAHARQGNARAAGPIRNRQMVRETLRRYPPAKGHEITALGFTRGPLELSRGTSNALEVAGKQGLATHHFRLDTFTREF